MKRIIAVISSTKDEDFREADIVVGCSGDYDGEKNSRFDEPG
jgi:hypothetical protein